MFFSSLSLRTRLLAAASLIAALFARAEFTTIYQADQTQVPGADMVGGGLGNGTVVPLGDILVFGTQAGEPPNPVRFLLAYEDAQLKTIFRSDGEFPTGGDYFNPVGASDGVYFTVTSKTGQIDSVIMKYGLDGSLSQTAVPSALTALGNGSGNYKYQLVDISADAQSMAILGYDASFPHWILRYADGQLQTIAQESVTDVPGAGVKFQRFSEPRISDDGSRIAFGATASGIEGLYYWQDDQLTEIVKKSDNYPGTEKPYAFFLDLPDVWFAPDNTLYFLAGTTWNPFNPDDYKGVFKYTPEGGMELVADNHTVIGDAPVGPINNFKIGDDGDIYFTGGTYLLAYDGTDLRIIRPLRQTTQVFWPIGDHVYMIRMIGLGGVIVQDLMRIDPQTGDTEYIHRFQAPTFDNTFSPHTMHISGQQVFFASMDGAWAGSTSDFAPGATIPQAAIFFNSRIDDAPNFKNNYYGWLYSEDAHWPWVYSYGAARWFYISNDRPYPLIAWAEDIGWLYTTHNTWPWFYDYQQNDWFYWE